MKTPSLILFNFTPERISQIASCAGELGFQVRPASPSEHRVPLFAISGPCPADPVTRPAFTGEMLVFASCGQKEVFAFLDRMRERGIAPVALKAVLTPANLNWTPERLHREVSAEHEALSRETPSSRRG